MFLYIHTIYTCLTSEMSEKGEKGEHSGRRNFWEIVYIHIDQLLNFLEADRICLNLKVLSRSIDIVLATYVILWKHKEVRWVRRVCMVDGPFLHIHIQYTHFWLVRWVGRVSTVDGQILRNSRLLIYVWVVRRVGSVSIMDAYVSKCQHRSETFGASGMGEKGEHSGWTKLRNSRLCIYL